MLLFLTLLPNSYLAVHEHSYAGECGRKAERSVAEGNVFYDKL